MGSQAFIVYKLVAKLFGATPVEVPMPEFGHDPEAMLDAVSSRTRLLCIASPNNPTGIANTEADLLALADRLPEHVILCLDEAYAEYLEHAPDLMAAIRAGRKVVCLRTFSKIYGLGGLRIGYAYAAPELIGLLHRMRQPFNVNSIAQAAATWEVRKKPNGQCEVVRVQGGPSVGTRVAGPFKNRKRAEEELKRLRNTPKCKK